MIRTADGRPPRTPKAGMLHRALAAGLPVPEGVVIAAEQDPPFGLAAFLPGPLVVRSAFDGEDSTVTSAAGRYTSILHVPSDADAVERAVAQVRGSADDAVSRADVLVMSQVSARHAGVAVLEPDHREDLVEVAEGLADALVSGRTPARTVALPRRDLPGWRGRATGRASTGRTKSGRSVSDADEGWTDRLARLLHDVRRTFGDPPGAGWDVEWADDGAVCWLVQVRPLLQPVVRNELLTLANHAEILPDLPSDFMASLIIERGGDLLAWYTTLDPRLPRSRPLMVERAGRPLLNRSLLADILQTWGLPTALLSDSMGGADGAATRPDPILLVRSLPALARMAGRQLSAVGDARTRGAELLQIAHRPATSMSDLVDVAGEVYTGLVTGMFALAGAHALQVAALTRAGVLDEVQRRHPTPAGDLARDLQAGIDRVTLLSRHGHRGVYESDLARPRFADAPDALPDAPPAAVTGGSPDRPAGTPARLARPPVVTTRRGTALLPLWWSARRSLAAREGLRDTGMRAFAVVRRRLLAGAADVLDDPADLWLLTVGEARWLDEGWFPDSSFLAERTRRREARAGICVPDPVGRLDPLGTATADGLSTDGDGPLSGRPLVAGSATGRAWVCTEPPTGPPPFEGPAILVARAVDGGWAAAFGQVEGVVLHLGGDLSHGALILRELGVPTITGVVDVQRRVSDGDLLRLDTADGTVTRQPDG